MTIKRPFVIETHNGFTVVRDDLLPGGTKQRVLERWLPELGPAEYVYAGPREGYAQVALAEACRTLGKGYTATIYVPDSKQFTDRTKAATRAGARYVGVRPGYLSTVRARAREYCEYQGLTSRRLIPFGMDDPRFIEIMAEIARGIPEPPEFWVAAGSGTLCRALMRAWPGARANAVQVGKTPYCGFAKVWVAPEKFHEASTLLPPVPSCPQYDAKVWRFVLAHAKPGALWWNVAA